MAAWTRNRCEDAPYSKLTQKRTVPSENLNEVV
jgi:hypothetical protein